jgi:hypothetical protein
MSALDVFFNLGNKATGGDPLRKALFDYLLYWIVFVAFVSIAINDFYLFFFGGASLNTLIWGIIILIFCWFNYFALSAFRGVYNNMKRFKDAQSLIKQPEVNQSKEDSVDDMLSEFKDAKDKD